MTEPLILRGSSEFGAHSEASVMLAIPATSAAYTRGRGPSAVGKAPVPTSCCPSPRLRVACRDLLVGCVRRGAGLQTGGSEAKGNSDHHTTV